MYATKRISFTSHVCLLLFLVKMHGEMWHRHNLICFLIAIPLEQCIVLKGVDKTRVKGQPLRAKTIQERLGGRKKLLVLKLPRFSIAFTLLEGVIEKALISFYWIVSEGV